MIRRSTLMLASTLGMAALLVGCQVHQPPAPSSEAEPKMTGIHLQLHQQSSDPTAHNAITLVSANETLHKAIRHAYPDAPITADSGIRLDQRLNVWAEGLSPARYLDYLGSQINAEIRYSDRGEIEVRSTTQWAFTLPRDEAAVLMPQAVQLAKQSGVTALVLGDSQHILVLNGNPGKLDTVRRALNQVSDRITLERNLSRQEATL